MLLWILEGHHWIQYQRYLSIFSIDGPVNKVVAKTLLCLLPRPGLECQQNVTRWDIFPLNPQFSHSWDPNKQYQTLDIKASFTGLQSTSYLFLLFGWYSESEWPLSGCLPSGTLCPPAVSLRDWPMLRATALSYPHACAPKPCLGSHPWHAALPRPAALMES